MTNEIEFHLRFILPLLDGRKTQTTRIHDRYGEVGDFLKVDGGENYGLRLQITAKRKCRMKALGYMDAERECLGTTQMLLKFWDSQYAGTAWESKNNPEVWVIIFRVISSNYRREWMKRMMSEKGLF